MHKATQLVKTDRQESRLTPIAASTFLSVAVLGLACTGLAGCGAVPTYKAAKEYRQWQSDEVARQLAECTEARAAAARAGGGSAKPFDCFLTLVDSSTRRLDSAGRVPGSLLPNEPDVTKPASIELYPALALDGAKSAEEVVSQVAWMAMLSKIVYRRHVDESIRNLPGKACDFQGHPLLRLNAALKRGPGVPPPSDASSQEGRWEQWLTKDSEGHPVGCLAEGGLFFETFVYRGDGSGTAPGPITHAVIVFRGTETYGDQTRQDWAANVGSAFNQPPAQFVVVRRELPRLIKELQKLSKGGAPLKIYTAGHSLGGGLAQLAAYMSPEVIAAYAFNTSPVTGWTWLQGLKKHDRDALQVPDPQVVRVSQDDEALGLVRLFTNAANSAVRRSGRTDVVFDFPSSRAVVAASKPKWSLAAGVELHSITLLACNLAARIATYEQGGAFGFRPEMAAQAILENDDSYTYGGSKVEGLCQVKINNTNCAVDWMSNAATCSVNGSVQTATSTGAAPHEAQDLRPANAK